MFTSWKMGPALAAGNTVVLKPAELTPLSVAADRRADGRGRHPGRRRQHRARASGRVAGEHLAEHPDVRKIAFTGSTATGRRIVEASAGNLKRVQLELGGKGANIVFDDAEPRGRGQRLGVRDLPQPGPGVHRRLAADPARVDRRRVPRPVRRAGRVDPAGQPARPGDRDGPADLGRPPRPRARLRRGRPRRRAARS